MFPNYFHHCWRQPLCLVLVPCMAIFVAPLWFCIIFLSWCWVALRPFAISIPIARYSRGLGATLGKCMEVPIEQHKDDAKKRNRQSYRMQMFDQNWSECDPAHWLCLTLPADLCSRIQLVSFSLLQSQVKQFIGILHWRPLDAANQANQVPDYFELRNSVLEQSPWLAISAFGVQESMDASQPDLRVILGH